MTQVAIRAGAILAIAFTASLASGQTASDLTGNFTFTGPATFSDSVSTTAESTQTMPPFTVMAPSFIFPSDVIAEPAAADDTSNGFYLTGRYDFLNGTGTSAQLSITASRPVTINAPGDGTTSEISGEFGIDGTDSSSFVNPVTGLPTSPSAATLESFFVVTYLEPGDTAQNTASSVGVPVSIPLTASFPDGSVMVTGPEGINASDPVTPGNYTLVQSTLIYFSDLIPGETVDVSLPEPIAVGLISLALLPLLRNRKRVR